MDIEHGVSYLLFMSDLLVIGIVYFRLHVTLPHSTKSLKLQVTVAQVGMHLIWMVSLKRKIKLQKWTEYGKKKVAKIES